MEGEEKGELIPERDPRVRSPEPVPDSNPVFEAETIVSGSFSRSRGVRPRSRVPTSLTPNTGTTK